MEELAAGIPRLRVDWVCTALISLPFWLALAGVAAAYSCYMVKPAIAGMVLQASSHAIYTLLDNKYYMDKFNEVVFAGGARLIGGGLWKVGDMGLIDGYRQRQRQACRLVRARDRACSKPVISTTMRLR